MNYRVAWKAQAERQLAALWLSSPDRAEVESSAREIDRRLGRAPRDFGESRDSPLRRIGAIPPLGVHFDIVPDDRLVVVIAAFRTQ